jgi:hypothetical protein
LVEGAPQTPRLVLHLGYSGSSAEHGGSQLLPVK